MVSQLSRVFSDWFEKGALPGRNKQTTPVLKGVKLLPLLSSSYVIIMNNIIIHNIFWMA